MNPRRKPVYVWVSRDEGDGFNHFVDAWSKRPNLENGKFNLDNFVDFYLGELAEIAGPIGLKPGECKRFVISEA